MDISAVTKRQFWLLLVWLKRGSFRRLLGWLARGSFGWLLLLLKEAILVVITAVKKGKF